MPDWSRRRALQAAAASLAAVAGCQSRGGGDEPLSRSQRVTEYEVEKARTTDANRLFGFGDDDGDEGAVQLFTHVTAANRRASLRFADVPPAARLESFVADTDLGSESLYLYQREVGACYDVQLTKVTREPDGVSASFCRDLRAADVACSADASAVTGYAIRLPFAGDDMNSVGAGFGSSCDGEHFGVAADRGGGRVVASSAGGDGE